MHSDSSSGRLTRRESGRSRNSGQAPASNEPGGRDRRGRVGTRPWARGDLPQTASGGLEDAVVAHRAEGDQVERTADSPPAAGKVPGALEGAAVLVVGTTPIRAAMASSRSRPSLGEFGHKGGSDHRADARHLLQPVGLGRQVGRDGSESAPTEGRGGAISVGRPASSSSTKQQIANVEAHG